jgi:hypothetical protein
MENHQETMVSMDVLSQHHMDEFSGMMHREHILGFYDMQMLGHSMEMEIHILQVRGRHQIYVGKKILPRSQVPFKK